MAALHGGRRPRRPLHSPACTGCALASEAHRPWLFANSLPRTMSSAYNTEPPTRGKVVLRTTVGELEVELWPKEAPKACRNFVQLCLEGYYDGVIFHRVVRDFIVQSGDPTGTGLGGESVYGEPFADEFHSRLRFTHRGLLAMANTGPNSNTSQFFFTLNKTEELNRRNTIFGKIVGDTIFNMLKIGELDTDKDDRPLNPPKILGANVLSNPFDDILPRSTAEERAHMRQLEQELLKAEEDARKPKSLHDAVDDPRLSKQVAAELSKELSKDSNDDSA
ncbi:cyclophilin-like domain-containing protein [Entophlyctis helioformis]|nr:cyclophilin-like domain-containing protein [Entophlyctis helioformis]